MESLLVFTFTWNTDQVFFSIFLFVLSKIKTVSEDEKITETWISENLFRMALILSHTLPTTFKMSI